MRLYWSGATVALLFVSLAVVAYGQDVPATENDDGDLVTEEPIKYVHVLNPGEREYLSPNLIGLQNIAMTFLPLSINFLNIVDAFREIVNGVRYDIIVNAIDTKANDDEIVCHLVILEKPWLRTEWGDKVRELEHSNCTTDATEESGDGGGIGINPYAKANSINDKYVKSTVFNGGSRNELSADDMKRLEDQIFPSAISSKRMPSSNNLRINIPEQEPKQDEEQIIKKSIEGETDDMSLMPTTLEPETNNVQESETMAKEEKEEVVQVENETTTAQPIVVIGDNEEATTETFATENNDDAITTTSYSATSTTTAVPELSENEKKWLDDIFSFGALNFENNLSAARSVGTQEDDNDNTQQQQQEEKIDEEPFVRVRRNSNLAGGVSQLDNDKAEKLLTKSLKKIATGDEPGYEVAKVYGATKQTVAGSLTKIDADLIDPEGKKTRCDIEIWSRDWLPDGNELTLKCANKPLVKRRHSRSVEYAEKKSHKKQNHHSLNKVEHLFSKFQVKYKRRYHTTMERQMRMRIFRQNLKIIQELNENERGSAKYGITEFADLTSAEYKQRTGLWQRNPVTAASTPKAVIPDVPLPKEFDWRDKGAVSPVKNQGNCGSCWAFSVTGNVEGLHAVRTGGLEQYSEQELLDCDTSDAACNGGLMDNAYEAIEKIGGLELENEYPYHGRKEQCRFNKAKIHVKVKGHVDLPKNETAIAQWLITNGPISIGINANAMQFYRGGVSHPWRVLCSHKNLDHGVLLVGYGVSEYPSFNKTLPYWIIKNSWGGKWGEQGYYRVYRGDNTCGVSEMASSALLAD